MNQVVDNFKESLNQLAIRHGLPPAGARFRSRHGVEWLVDGHVYSKQPASLRSCSQDEGQERADLYPVILPQNLSPELSDFYSETDRCTSRIFLILDTAPYLPGRPHHPESNSVYGLDNSPATLMYLDAQSAHESIIAHEVGHVWIDVVEGCEDYRKLKDTSDPARLHQWLSIQSFVLDQKVNEVLRDRGFDLTIFDTHTREGLTYYSFALMTGYRPQYAREAAFVAMTLAAAVFDREVGVMNSLDPLDTASSVFRSTVPDVFQLACGLVSALSRHGYADHQSIIRTIDEWASLTFRFVGEPFDLERDLEERRPPEPYIDKYPQYFSDLRVVNKLEIARLMARMKIRPGTRCRISYTQVGTARAEFEQESGEWTKPIVLTTLRVLPEPFSHIEPPLTSPTNGAVIEKLFQGTQLQHHSQLPHVGVYGPPNGARAITPAALPLGAQPDANCGPLNRMSPPNPTAFARSFVAPTRPHARFPRDYTPGIARFVGAARLAQQLGSDNPYVYAMNNPVNWLNPSGRQAEMVKVALPLVPKCIIKVHCWPSKRAGIHIIGQYHCGLTIIVNGKEIWIDGQSDRSPFDPCGCIVIGSGPPNQLRGHSVPPLEVDRIVYSSPNAADCDCVVNYQTRFNVKCFHFNAVYATGEIGDTPACTSNFALRCLNEKCKLGIDETKLLPNGVIPWGYYCKHCTKFNDEGHCIEWEKTECP